MELAFQIGKTVCDFFHFYHFEFDYAHRVVSISQPGVQYKKHKGWSDCFCVEDPYNPDFNVVSGITKQVHVRCRRRPQIVFTNCRSLLNGQGCGPLPISWRPRPLFGDGICARRTPEIVAN